MDTEISLHIKPDETIAVNRKSHPFRGWIEIGPVTIFGSPEQLNALTDQLVALRPVAESETDVRTVNY